MNLKDTCQSFQRTIRAISVVAKIPPEAVFGLWKKYSRECENGDQSPILGEFVRWYANDLGGDAVALEDAVTFSGRDGA